MLEPRRSRDRAAERSPAGAGRILLFIGQPLDNGKRIDARRAAASSREGERVHLRAPLPLFNKAFVRIRFSLRGLPRRERLRGGVDLGKLGPRAGQGDA